MISYVTCDLQVCTGTTGHAEAVKFEYDPEKLNYGDMVRKAVYLYGRHVGGCLAHADTGSSLLLSWASAVLHLLPFMCDPGGFWLPWASLLWLNYCCTC